MYQEMINSARYSKQKFTSRHLTLTVLDLKRSQLFKEHIMTKKTLLLTSTLIVNSLLLSGAEATDGTAEHDRLPAYTAPVSGDVRELQFQLQTAQLVAGQEKLAAGEARFALREANEEIRTLRTQNGALEATLAEMQARIDALQVQLRDSDVRYAETLGEGYTDAPVMYPRPGTPPVYGTSNPAPVTRFEREADRVVGQISREINRLAEPVEPRRADVRQDVRPVERPAEVRRPEVLRAGDRVVLAELRDLPDYRLHIGGIWVFALQGGHFVPEGKSGYYGHSRVKKKYTGSHNIWQGILGLTATAGGWSDTLVPYWVQVGEGRWAQEDGQSKVRSNEAIKLDVQRGKVVAGSATISTVDPHTLA